MRRREFIAGLGSAVVGPLATAAQQRERVRRIGVLIHLSDIQPAARRYVAAFRQGLKELGWTEGDNVRVDVRWNAGDPERVRSYAAELVALDPDVVLACSWITPPACRPPCPRSCRPWRWLAFR
jgi:putative tryptophan/tyrosine transport system substrate-binding protein